MAPDVIAEITEENIVEEFDLFRETLEAFMDNFRAGRYRRATSDLFFAYEHLLKAGLLSVGVEARSHDAVARLFSYHFVKPQTVSVEVVRHFSNLRDRRTTAEYSCRAGWEFGAEEALTYYGWLKKAVTAVFPVLIKRAPYLKEEAQAVLDLLAEFEKELQAHQSSP